MTELKLTYFDLRARGETARLILTYAGVDFEDDRVEHKVGPGSEIAALQASGVLRYNQLPRLTVGGEELYQSMAICRYLAKQYRLDGATNMINAQVDEIVDAIEDIFTKTVKAFFTADPAQKEANMAEVLGTIVPEDFLRLEKVLASRGGQFFAGNSFTWADLHFLHIVDMVLGFSPNDQLLKATPKLESLVERTRALPAIAAYLAKRPQTPL